MHKVDPVDVLKIFANIPTAPFKEHLIQRSLMEILARQFTEMNSFTMLAPTRHGIIASYTPQDCDPHSATLLFTAHTDHPGFDDVRPIQRDTFSARVLGGLNNKLLVGTRVDFYNHQKGENPVGSGTIEELLEEKPSIPNFHLNPRVRIKSDEPLEGATFGMLHVPLFAEGSDGILSGRVMDDYAGVAGVLTAFETIMLANIACPTQIILYRGEEEGFLGLFGHLKENSIKASTVAISVENSNYKTKLTPEATEIAPVVSLGKGAVIRTGDKSTSLYDPTAIGLVKAAAARIPAHSFQEARMCGGTCDASLMYAAGLNATGVCLPLKGYHNSGESEGVNGFISEQVHRNDLHGLSELLVSCAVQMANDPKTYKHMPRLPPNEALAPLVGKVEARYEYFKRLFDN
jgi:putative aminopeptidase FrvX